MPTKIKRNPSEPLERPDYIRFSWKRSKPPEDGITINQESEEGQLSQDLLDLEEKLKVKSRRK